ncbi:UNVERIFIED_CONTAM: hypothetical protein K2H54_058057 [Gekko kuhli]
MIHKRLTHTPKQRAERPFLPMSDQEAAPAAPEAAPSAAQPAPAAEPAPAPATEAAPPAPEPAAPAPAPSAPEPKKPKGPSPGQPVNLTVDDVNDNSVTLTWDAPEQVGPKGLDGYLSENY